MKEAYQYYLPFLENTKSVLPQTDESGNASGVSFYHPNVAEEFAREVVEHFAPEDPAVKELRKKLAKTADQIPEIKKWLQSRIDARKE